MSVFNKADSQRVMLQNLARRGAFAHAYIIESEDMSAASELADFAARLLLCTADGEKPCGRCGDCRKLASGTHPDLQLLGSGGGKLSFHIAQIRQMRADAYITANEGTGKVFVLENAQDMTPQAQNALLKLLEEPPRFVFLFLLTKRREMLLPTVVSRCQIITLSTNAPSANAPNAATDEAVPEIATNALGRLFDPRVSEFDFFSFFINMRPKRDDAQKLIGGMLVLAGELQKPQSLLPEVREMKAYVKPTSAAAILPALYEAMDSIEGNANINALFTALAYKLWQGRNV